MNRNMQKMSGSLKLYLLTIMRLRPIQLVYQVYRYLIPVTKAFASSPRTPSPIPRLLSATSADTFKKNGTMHVLNYPVYAIYKNEFLESKSDYLPRFSFFYFSWALTQDLGTVRNLLQQSMYWSDMHYFMHPYVVSKRLINLSVLISLDKNELLELREQLFQRIWTDYQFLRRNLEHHIGANHLLTNFAALALASKIFDVKKSNYFQRRYWREFKIQFKERLHFERSPAYSAQLLNEALVVYQISGQDIVGKEVMKRIANSIRFLDYLSESGLKLNFIDNIWSQSPTPEQLICLSHSLGLELGNFSISSSQIECGFMLFNRGNFTAALDAGFPSPSHQPGHTHDATAAVEVAFKGQPVLVNPDITSYERSYRRFLERSRLAHSTIQSCGEVQGVWSAFRVARRIRPLTALGRFEGVCKLRLRGWIGSRHLQLFDDHLLITDRSSNNRIASRYFIATSVTITKVSSNKVSLELLTGERLIFECVNGKCNVVQEIWGGGYGIEKAYTIIDVDWNSKEGRINLRRAVE